MSMPVDINTPDVSNVAEVSADVWEQTMPVGGEDFKGRPPARATAVTVTGIVTVREVPTLGAAAQVMVLKVGDACRVVGRTDQRRFITLCANQDMYVSPQEQPLEASSPVGLFIPANTLWQTSAAVEIWAVAATTAGQVTFWAELDQG